MRSPRHIAALLAVTLLAGCGDSRSASPPGAASATTRPEQVLAPPASEKYKYDAYGPRQYSVFSGIPRDNVFYRPSSGPTTTTTGPVGDSVIFPTDDAEW
jgi:hypothetical protein